jgi:hypothetical protein
MGIDLLWRNTAGELLDAAYDGSSSVSDAVNRLRGDRSRRQLLASSIDPYGNTRFSSGQAPQLLREFVLLREESPSPEERIALGRVISILRAAEGTTDEWLEFAGD